MVKTMMTPFPHAISVDASVYEAREMMYDHGIRHLPVVEKDSLVGLITDRDIKRALDPEMGFPPEEKLQVSDVAVPDIYTVESSTPLHEVLDDMAQMQIGSAIVTLHGKLAGIFTATDACRWFAEFLRDSYPTPEGEQSA